jgi:retron-type reverse transcriptase
MPTKLCALDLIPTFLLKDLISCLAPFVTSMCNAPLKEGNLPTSQRHALVTPLLKKSNLDIDQLANYRPVSNLTFMSKVVERLVARQLTDYLQSNALMPSLQSAYRKHHSTETALLRVTSDIMLAADQGQVTLLALLDLSAAFDTVDHDLLLQRLSTTFGINGAAHGWITSFLTNRTQQVVHGGGKSAHVQLTSGVPQGSVLSPLLFVLHTAELSASIKKHGLTPHCYADDIQIYLSAPAADAGAVAQRANVDGDAQAARQGQHQGHQHRLHLAARLHLGH